MGLLTILLTALALSVDAFVCSVICGKRPLVGMQRWATGLQVSLSFGFFQFLMPVIGFFAGISIHKYFSEYDHWVAFILLAGVALNMLKEAFFEKDDEKEDEKDHSKLLDISLWALLAMSIATSIDALAVGVSYGMLSSTIMFAAAVIGVVCTMCSFLGFSIGQYLSRFQRLDPCLNVIGALVLLGISINILLEHHAF